MRTLAHLEGFDFKQIGLEMETVVGGVGTFIAKSADCTQMSHEIIAKGDVRSIFLVSGTTSGTIPIVMAMVMVLMIIMSMIVETSGYLCGVSPANHSITK